MSNFWSHYPTTLGLGLLVFILLSTDILVSQDRVPLERHVELTTVRVKKWSIFYSTQNGSSS